MSGFIADNSTYNIENEYSMSVILSHFDTDYIYGVIINKIRNKYFEISDIVNIPYTYNENFKQLLSIYTNDNDRELILQTRNTIYTEIIDLLCKSFDLEFNPIEDQIDLYNPVYYLFDLLVSGFTNYVIIFFANYIVKERNNLYNSLNLGQYKREKDSSTIYNKKRINNTKLAIIISKLSYVIDNICCHDITFENYVNTVCFDKSIASYITSIVSSKSDFFKKFVVPMFNKNSPIQPMLISDITIALYNQANSDINLLDYIEDED